MKMGTRKITAKVGVRFLLEARTRLFPAEISRAVFLFGCTVFLAGCSGDDGAPSSSDVYEGDSLNSDVRSGDAGYGDIIAAGDGGPPTDITESDALFSDLPADTSPDLLEPVWTFGPVEGEEVLWIETLTTQPATWVSALGGGHALWLAEDGLWQFGAEGSSAITAPEDFDFTALISATKTTKNHVVVLTENNLYVIQEGALILSPLATELGAEILTVMLRVGPSDHEVFWFGGIGGLRRWSEGVLHTLDLGDLPADNPLLTYGGGPTGSSKKERIWVSADSHIYEIERSDEGFLAWPDRQDLHGDQIVGDSLGGLWVRAGAQLHRRHPGGLWEQADPGFDIAEIQGDPHWTSLWLRSHDGALFRWTGASLRESTGTPDSVHDAAEPEGNLLIAGAHGVARAHPGRIISFSGISPGAVLQESAEVKIEPAFPELIDEVIAAIDDEEGAALEAPYKVLIDLEGLPDGAHILSVQVRYTDGFPESSGALDFVVEHPVATWADDIKPIADIKCGLCHGQAGTLEFKLFTKEQWVANINQIVNALETELMPPGPTLADELIDTIKLWRDLDFPD
jgi:hypothetical protein